MRVRIVQLVGIAVVCSCGEPQFDRVADQDLSPPPASAPVRDSGPLATRVEAQRAFDRARAALTREDYRELAQQLDSAVAFMRSHAAESEIGALAALQGATKELEVLTARLQRGEAPTMRTLDRVFANANRAEAQYHLARAVASLARSDHRASGEELLMAADHLERSARDLRQPNDSMSGRVFVDARSVAERLIRGPVPSRAELKRTTTSLLNELRRVCAIIDVEARACAIEAARD